MDFGNTAKEQLTLQMCYRFLISPHMFCVFVPIFVCHCCHRFFSGVKYKHLGDVLSLKDRPLFSEAVSIALIHIYLL